MGPRGTLPRGAQRLPHGYFRGALSGAPVAQLHPAGGDEVNTDIFLRGSSAHGGVTFCIYRRTGGELFWAAGRCSY